MRGTAAVRLGKRGMLHLLLASFGIVMIYPILWMFFGSFKPTAEIFSDTGLWPRTWFPDNYNQGWSGMPRVDFGSFFGNSFVVSLLVVVFNIGSCSIVAYAFARMRFALQGLWFAVMLVTMMLPTQVTLIPQYLLFHELGWTNTYLPLTVPHLFAISSFFVFLLIQFIRGLPRELDEAATIDGCSAFGIYWRIVMPLCAPAIITTGIFSFIWTWDDFFSQLIYINDIEKYTVPLGLRLFLDGTGGSQWGPMFAMSMLSLIPSFLVFLFAQKHFVQGIATSGLKG